MNFWFRQIPVPDWSPQNVWTGSFRHIRNRILPRRNPLIPYFSALSYWLIPFSHIFLMKVSPKSCFIVWHIDKFRTFVAIQYARRGIYWVVLIGRLQTLSSKSKSRKFDSTRRYGTIGVHVWCILVACIACVRIYHLGMDCLYRLSLWKGMREPGLGKTKYSLSCPFYWIRQIGKDYRHKLNNQLIYRWNIKDSLQ